jgi:parvulin-like peptidyl-prolyl isomerase
MRMSIPLLLALALFSAACGDSGKKTEVPAKADPALETDNRVIVTIGTVSVTNRDLKNFIQLQHADLLQQKNSAKLLSRLFDVFCEQQIILYKAGLDGIQVSEAEVNEYLEQIRSKRQEPLLDMAAVKNALKVQKYLLANAYRDIDVSDAEVSRFYESHLTDFRRSEEIRLSQILVKDRDKLLAIRQQLLSQPSRFEELARSESLSPEAANGGAMGSFERGMLPQEMEGVVFSLPVNQISPIVESPYGFHLFKVTQRRKARTLLLAAVRDEIRDKMLSARMETAYQDVLAGLKAENPLQIRYDDLFFSYIKSDPGVSENETKNLPDGDSVPGF